MNKKFYNIGTLVLRLYFIVKAILPLDRRSFVDNTLNYTFTSYYNGEIRFNVSSASVQLMKNLRWKERQTDRETERQTDRQADRLTGRQADRQTDRQADRQTGRQADRQTGRQTDRQTDKL